MISPCVPRVATLSAGCGDLSCRAHESGSIDFSLIVPTYNERDNLPHLFDRLDQALAGSRFEVIVVDDNSPDGTSDAAKQFQIRYPWLVVICRRAERGLGSAVLCGFRQARGKILGVMDADLQHDHTRLPMLLEQMKRCDFAVATRRAAGGTDGKWNRARRFVSSTATLLAKRITHIPLSDPMSGFFMMQREIFAAIDDAGLRPQGYKILLYLYTRASEMIGRELRLNGSGIHLR